MTLLLQLMFFGSLLVLGFLLTRPLIVAVFRFFRKPSKTQLALDTLASKIHDLQTQVENLHSIVRTKQDALSDDDKFLEESKLSNIINRVASHAGRKAAEERVLPQVDKMAENWLVKNVPALEAVIRANVESIYKVVRRPKPIKVKLDTRNLGPEFKGLVAYMKPVPQKAKTKKVVDQESDPVVGD